MGGVIVIGAGISGLSIGEFLRDYNYNNILFLERNNYLGGRIKSIKVNSSVVDIGSQFFCKSDRYIWDLIHRKNLEKDVVKLDFSDISFLYDGKIYKDYEKIAALIDDIITKFKTSKKNIKDTTFDKWFLMNFKREDLFIPESLIRSIAFSSTKEISTYYAAYVLETFFEECYSLKYGLGEIIDVLSKGVKVYHDEVKAIILEGNKATYIVTSERNIPIHDKIVISSAPPLEVDIIGNETLKSTLSSIKFKGCSVAIFKTKKIFEDEPTYIFIADDRYPISVVEQIDTGKDTFIGCLLPYESGTKPPRKAVIDLCEKILRKIFNKDFKNVIEKILYESWDKGLPLVDINFERKIRRLHDFNFQNFAIIGDYTTLYPSMNSAVKSSWDLAKSMKD